MTINYDIDISDQDCCPRYKAEMERIETIIITSKRELTIKEIKLKYKTDFLADILKTLLSENRISINEKCVSRTLYGKPIKVEPVEIVPHKHMTNYTTKNTNFGFIGKQQSNKPGVSVKTTSFNNPERIVTTNERRAVEIAPYAEIL